MSHINNIVKTQLPPTLQAAIDKAKELAKNNSTTAPAAAPTFAPVLAPVKVPLSVPIKQEIPTITQPIVVKQAPIAAEQAPARAAANNTNGQFNFNALPNKGSLKSRKDDPKMAEKIASYQQKFAANQQNSIQRKLDSLTSDKLPMSLNVASLNDAQKAALTDQLTAKGYTISAPKTQARAQRQARANKVSADRAAAIATRKAAAAAKQTERAKNPKNVADANKENAADAAILAQKSAKQARVDPSTSARANAVNSAFPRTKKVDTLVVN